MNYEEFCLLAWRMLLICEIESIANRKRLGWLR